MTLGTFLTPRQRRERNRTEMIEAILALAREQMRQDGVAALNLNALARRLKMKTPSLYTYFPNKMAIYDALYRRGLELFMEQMRGVLDSCQTAIEFLNRHMETYMAFALQHPELYQLVFERPVPGFVPSAESLAVSEAGLRELHALVANLIARQELAPDLPPEAATNLMIAVIHGLTALHLANEPHLPVGEGRFGSLVPAAADLLWHAWSPREPKL